MPALILNTCCGCIELRTGCLIIAYFNLVMEIILIILGLVALIGGSVITVDANDDKQQEIGITVIVVTVIILLLLFLFLAFTIVLLVGLHQNKRGHLKAYLIYACIFTVVSVVMFFASFAGPISAGSIIQNLISFALTIYFILVIRSYYYKLDDKRPAIYNTA